MPKEISVVLPARNEVESFQKGFIQSVLDVIPDEYDKYIVVAVNNSSREFENLADEIARNIPNVIILQLGNLAPYTFAYAYLKGLQHAVDDGWSKIVEMDASGAHDPVYIPDFISALEKSDIALSSRFSKGSAIDRYPLQRKLISKGGTYISNFLFALENIPDMTSGYQGFNNKALNNLFSLVSLERWISAVDGPGHFYQTEMRVRLLKMGNTFSIVPIKWGTDRAVNPKNLSWSTVIKALLAAYKLRNDLSTSSENIMHRVG